MKKLLLMICVGILMQTTLTAQQGLPEWVFPGADNMIYDNVNFNLSGIPTGPNPEDYQGANPVYCYANSSDDNGDLNFFIVDDKIFDKDGYLIDTLTSENTPGSYEGLLRPENTVSIINVPGECEKYFIVYFNNIRKGSGINVESGFFYVELDMQANNYYYPNRKGAITINHKLNGLAAAHGFVKPITQMSTAGNVNSNSNTVFGGFTSLFTELKNNQRYMYLTGLYGLERWIVTNQGFVYDNYDASNFLNFKLPNITSGIFATGSGFNSFVDSDIQKDDDGNYKIAFPTNGGGTNFPSWTDGNLYNWGHYCYVMVAYIDGNSGDVVDYFGVNLPNSFQASAEIKGLEFSKDGHYLYISAPTNNNQLYYVDLNNLNGGDHFIAQPLNFSDESRFQLGNIEKGNGNKLYFASQDGLGVLDDSNDPNSSWDANGLSFLIAKREGFYSSTEDDGYSISSHLNYENYNHKDNLNANIFTPVSVCADNTFTAFYDAYDHTGLSYLWSNNATTYNTTYTSASYGVNNISILVSNEFGCENTIYKTVNVKGAVQFQFNTTSNYSCSNGNYPTIGFQAYYQDQGNSVAYVSWTKNGSHYSYGSPIVANGPGEYCVTIEDYLNGCAYTECITINPYACDITLNANFSTATLSTGGGATFQVDVMSQQSPQLGCLDYSWEVYEVTPQGNVLVHDEGGFANGTLNWAFNQNGTVYKIKHIVTGPCGSVEYTRTVYQPDSEGEGEGESEGRLRNTSKDKMTLSLYPNPTTGKLNLPSNLLFSNYRVLNIHGQRVLEGNYSNSIDLSELIDGIYTVVLLDNENMIHQQKIVKY